MPEPRFVSHDAEMSSAVNDIHRDVSARNVAQMLMRCNKMCQDTSPIDIFPANMELAMRANMLTLHLETVPVLTIVPTPRIKCPR